MYKQLFALTGLSNYKISKILGVDCSTVRYYQNAKTINTERFILFGKKLGITDKQMTDLVVSQFTK